MIRKQMNASCDSGKKAAFPVKKNDKAAAAPENGYEICISCGQLTDVPLSTPVGYRIGYVCGCGQLFRSCAEKTGQASPENCR